MGSFFVKVRLRLGLAWLMGMVLPCREILLVGSIEFNLHPNFYLFLAHKFYMFT